MINFLNKYVFGTTVPVILILAGIYFAFKLKFFHLRHPKKILRSMTKKQGADGVSPFRALTLALAGTLGVGNIVGVSAAIYMGGFGSIFWMWASAVCAMLLKYAEIVLAMRHRRVGKDGRMHGAAMYYIKDFFASKKMVLVGSAVAFIFSTFCILNALTMGSVIQVNAIVSSFEGIFGIPPLVTGIFLTLACALIVTRSTEIIAKFTEKLVPIMTLVYVIMSLAVIIIKIEDMGDVIRGILGTAFKTDAAVGGVIGFFLSRALRFGTMRGIISNEAGCGTAPAAHGVSSAKSAAEQGFWGIFEVFADTIVLCTMTAFVVILSYDSVVGFGEDFIMMTIGAYAAVLGDFAGYILTISVLCFGFATVVCWGHYGTESAYYISETKTSRRIFLILYCSSVFVGAFASSTAIWEAADFAIGVMTLINITVLLLMSKEVKEETDSYFKLSNLKKIRRKR